MPIGSMVCWGFPRALKADASMANGLSRGFAFGEGVGSGRFLERFGVGLGEVIGAMKRTIGALSPQAMCNAFVLRSSP